MQLCAVVFNFEVPLILSCLQFLIGLIFELVITAAKPGIHGTRNTGQIIDGKKNDIENNNKQAGHIPVSDWRVEESGGGASMGQFLT